MDVLDLFFRKYAYKFPKGYPDMNNEQDILLLESLLEQVMGLDENFNPLTFFDLNKRGGFRFGILADKIKQGAPFNLTKGESTPLKFISSEYEEAFKNQDANKIRSFAKGNINLFPFFTDDAGKKYSIADLLKDSTFGGKGKGSGTVVEDYNLKLLNDQILKAVEENDGAPINIIVNGKKYDNIVGAVSQKGMPKADFNLINSSDIPVVFISHKKAGGKGPSSDDFIRWSGYTMYANHPEVKAFNDALKKWLEENNLEGLPNQTRFITPIKDDELIRKLIYGPNYGKVYGPENVNLILQGKISLVPEDKDTYKLEAEHVESPPSVPQGSYTPYLTAGYRGDREMFGIKNNEAIVMTKSIAGKASNVYELKGDKFVKIR